ncbi:hypothetical protein CEK25_007566 [Fusarium fujikuroi]|nr:hypothetical protein CEK25_007566 [Fusarium fujikuroi]
MNNGEITRSTTTAFIPGDDVLRSILIFRPKIPRKRHGSRLSSVHHDGRPIPGDDAPDPPENSSSRSRTSEAEKYGFRIPHIVVPNDIGKIAWDRYALLSYRVFTEEERDQFLPSHTPVTSLAEICIEVMVFSDSRDRYRHADHQDVLRKNVVSNGTVAEDPTVAPYRVFSQGDRPTTLTLLYKYADDPVADLMDIELHGEERLCPTEHIYPGTTPRPFIIGLETMYGWNTCLVRTGVFQGKPETTTYNPANFVLPSTFWKLHVKKALPEHIYELGQDFKCFFDGSTPSCTVTLLMRAAVV